MSRAFRACQITRCPFCQSGGVPAHLTNGVMRCDACGQTFRVLHASPGNTGQRLTAKLRARGVRTWRELEKP